MDLSQGKGLPDRTIDALTRGPENVEAVEGMVLFDGPEAVDLFRLISIRSALRFEVRTGMKMTRVSALAAANEVLGTTYRRKQQALDHLDGLLSAFDEDGD